MTPIDQCVLNGHATDGGGPGAKDDRCQRRLNRGQRRHLETEAEPTEKMSWHGEGLESVLGEGGNAPPAAPLQPSRASKKSPSPPARTAEWEGQDLSWKQIVAMGLEDEWI